MPYLIPILIVLFPLLWLASEFQERRWLRVLAGCAAIATSYLVASAVGGLAMLNANAWYGSASKTLVDTTIERLEAGETDRLLSSLRQLQSEFQPTSGSRANYDSLVHEFQVRLADESASQEARPAEAE